MQLIALTGKPRSGKTSLAKALEKHGYLLINFTDTLKSVACNVLSEYVDVTLDDIYDNKEKYRGFLQELGTHIGFDTDEKWVRTALYGQHLGIYQDKIVPYVFDNVRTPEQWEVLKGYGFKLVRLTSSRSLPVWKPVGELFVAQSQHPIESALDHVEADLTLNGDLEVEYLVWKVLNS